MYDSEDYREITGSRFGFMDNPQWKTAVMIGSLAAAGLLLFTGRRAAGIAVAGIGVATLAAEHPDKLEEFWNRAPEYLEKGSRLVQGIGDFLENLAEQNARLQSVRSRYPGEQEYRA